MIEDHKSTAKEELKWRAEFETLGREAVSQRDQTLNGCCGFVGDLLADLV